MDKADIRAPAPGGEGAGAGKATPAWDSARRQVGGGRLSVIMPAHGLGAVIAGNVRRVRDLLAGQIPFEIVVVNDGSPDNTRAELDASAAAIPELMPVHLAYNAGKGAALRFGFEASRGNFVLFLDADLDLPPEQISTFFDVMERERADVVIGSKRHPDSRLDYPWHRRLVSTAYYGLVRLLVGLPVRDTQTGIKLFRREALEWAFPRMLVKRFAFDLELLAIAHERGFRLAESPVVLEFHSRWGGIGPSAVRQVLNDTLAIFYRLRLLRYYQTLRVSGMPEPPPRVSVVVAYPKPTPQLEECVEGVLRQTYRHYEILLLPDEASGRSWPEPVREIPTGKRRPAEKRNIGIREATGEIVAFIDDDAFPVENWLQQALAHFSDPTVAALGGPATTPGNDGYLARMSGRVLANRLVSGQYRYRYVPVRVCDTDDYPSCNLLVRSDVLRTLGGFRTDFWPGEDTYLCMQIVKDLGRRIVYDPRVQVYHHRRRLFLPHLRQIGRYALHRGYFARRFPATSRRVSYMLPSLFVAGLVAGGALSFLSPAWRAAYLAGLAVYGVVTLLCAFSIHPATWLLTWLGVMLTHVVYGARFMAGLFARRLPSEVRAFDHPSETGTPVRP